MTAMMQGIRYHKRNIRCEKENASSRFVIFFSIPFSSLLLSDWQSPLIFCRGIKWCPDGKTHFHSFVVVEVIFDFLFLVWMYSLVTKRLRKHSQTILFYEILSFLSSSFVLIMSWFCSFSLYASSILCFVWIFFLSFLFGFGFLGITQSKKNKIKVKLK